jgi:hypothetical protein
MEHFKDFLTSLLPEYIGDKVTSKDFQQVYALPENIREALLNGTQDEFCDALSDIRARERFQGPLLGDAAMEYIYDYRSMYTDI